MESSESLSLQADAWRRLDGLVSHLYPGREVQVQEGIHALVARYGQSDGGRSQVDERSAFLIAYGDQVTARDEPPLRTLLRFLRKFGQHLSAVHILPFFPYTSDDGFSVVDYLQVREDLGTWDDIAAIAAERDLMIDAVLNHVSRSSTWFRAYLAGESGFEGLALAVDPEVDLAMVTRPRTTPVLTRFRTDAGDDRWAWTTFSDDQVDVNYQDPTTLLRVIKVVLEYARRGGSFLRIDAATYLWKELGTTCASLPNTHRLVQLLRAALDLTFPGTTVITETNVPHQENISYLSNDEAQLVYNFALPPLVLHTISSGDASHLSAWVRELQLPPGTTFFNFLASHDGIGLRGVESILAPVEIEALAARTLRHGGHVSLRSDEGRATPYELNISYIDALTAPDEPDKARIARFRLAHAIALSLRGVPGVYLHSLVGSRSAPHLVQLTGAARSINRERLDFLQVETELADESSLRSLVYRSLDKLLVARASTPAFHPLGEQHVVDVGPCFFALRREHEGQTVLCVHNVTGEIQTRPAGAAGELIFATSRSDVVEPWGVRWYRLGP